MRRPAFGLDDIIGFPSRYYLERGDAKLERWLSQNTIKRGDTEFPVFVYAMRVADYKEQAFVISKEAFDYGIDKGNKLAIDGEIWQDRRTRRVYFYSGDWTDPRNW
jgi:hypothetical protein